MRIYKHKVLTEIYNLDRVSKNDLIETIIIFNKLVKALDGKIKEKDKDVNKLLAEVISLTTKFTNTSEEDATRDAFELIYEDRQTFLNKLPEEYLTPKENEEWFDNFYENTLEPSAALDMEIYNLLSDGYISENDRKLLKEATHADQR